MSTKFGKSKGITKDTQNCEFHYVRLTEEETHEEYVYGKLEKTSTKKVFYYCDEFPEMSTSTLKELKVKMGKM